MQDFIYIQYNGMFKRKTIPILLRKSKTHWHDKYERVRRWALRCQSDLNNFDLENKERSGSYVMQFERSKSFNDG